MNSIAQLLLRKFTSLAAVGFVALAVAGCASQQAAVDNKPKNYSFWPPSPDEPRVQFLTSFNSSKDIAPARSSFEEAVYGKEQGGSLDLNKPYGLAMWNGRIYVTDIRGKGITVLDIRNQQTRVMGATGMGAVSKAWDVAVSADGMKYVVDPTQNVISVFSPDERFVRVINSPDVRPVSVAVYKDLLYVTDFTNKCVHAIDRRSGQVVRKIGSSGSEDGQFHNPIGVACDKDGNVYVSDWFRCRIQKFSPDGTLLAAWGQYGRQPGTFYRPKHLDVASDGITYVVDAVFNNVQLFDEENKVMMDFGSPGNHPGAMDLPAGITIHEGDLDLFQKYIHPAFKAERLILVTNQFGPSKISVYAMGGLKPGKTLADIANRASVELPAQPLTTQPTTAPAREERP